MTRYLSIFAALAALLIAPFVSAANLPYFTGPTGANPAVVPGNVADMNSLVLAINNGITSQSTSNPALPRNLLDNGSIDVAQRGTGVVTGATTGGCASSTYDADRWCVVTNVTSGAGRGQVVTSSPSPQAGFANSMKVYRNSGALTQPVCVIQEVPTSQAIRAQGQPVTFSVSLEALSGLIGDNGGIVNLYVIYGTGSDEGLGTFTASPAITPAWTGINSSITAATAALSSSTWGRYSISGTIPTTANEVGVEICFTPTATGAGTTDGFAFQGAQLEIGASPSTFEFQAYNIELLQAQRYYYQYADSLANTFTLPMTCTETTSGTTATCIFLNPVPMRAAPTVAVATATSFGMTKVADGTAEACSTLAVVASSATVSGFRATCAASETAAVGTMHIGLYANTGAANTLTVSADF